MIFNCMPTIANHDETLSTLRCAKRASLIKNCPKVNDCDSFTSPLRAAHEHLKTLRAERLAAEQQNMLKGIRDMLEVSDMGYVVVDLPEDWGECGCEEECDVSFEVISRDDARA